jgi:hypothetical protein
MSTQLRVPLTYGGIDSAGDTVPVGWESVFQPIGSINWPPTYADMSSLSYAELGGLFSLRDVVHGNSNGLVMAHDNSIVHRSNDSDATDNSPVLPAYCAEFGTRVQGSARYLFTVDRASLEYITWRPSGQVNTGNTVTVFSSGDTANQTDTVTLNTGSEGDVRMAKYWFRFTDNSIGMKLSGNAPVAIRSIDLDVFVHDDAEIR